jgi:hypothetical protein
VAGGGPASATSTFAGLWHGHEVSILITIVGAVAWRCTVREDLDDDDHAATTAWTGGLARTDGGSGGLVVRFCNGEQLTR